VRPASACQPGEPMVGGNLSAAYDHVACNTNCKTYCDRRQNSHGQTTDAGKRSARGAGRPWPRGRVCELFRAVAT
jgi:hypothetical protein